MNLKRILVPLAFLGILVFCSFVMWENRGEQASPATEAAQAAVSGTAEAATAGGIEWLTLAEAYKRNLKEPRKTFIDVYTDWCGWCKRMDANTFSNGDVASYANKNFYAVKLNAESNKVHVLGKDTMTEAAVAASMGVRSYPTIVFMEKDFRTITPMSGYRDATQFLEVLKNVHEAKAAE